MKTISCIILDDEPLAVKLLHDYAQKIAELEVVYAGSDVYKVIDLLRSKTIDLIFLDIQMPELTGMEIMQLFNREHNFIITSAYQEYALDAYQFKVVDFLLKPITFNRFYQAVEKFIQWQESFQRTPVTGHLMVKADRKHHQVAVDTIIYIEGLKDYIRIHTANDKIIVWENMKDILEKLPAQQFIRIHRSYIIPVNKIKLIEGNRVQLQNQEYLPIGETYRKMVADWLGKY
jgi:two-component system LytT family response regulator